MQICLSFRQFVFEKGMKFKRLQFRQYYNFPCFSNTHFNRNIIFFHIFVQSWPEFCIKFEQERNITKGCWNDICRNIEFQRCIYLMYIVQKKTLDKLKLSKDWRSHIIWECSSDVENTLTRSTRRFNFLFKHFQCNKRYMKRMENVLRILETYYVRLTLW